MLVLRLMDGESVVITDNATARRIVIHVERRSGGQVKLVFDSPASDRFTIHRSEVAERIERKGAPRVGAE